MTPGSRPPPVGANPGTVPAELAGLPIHTTFVTGILTYVGEEAVNGWYARRDQRQDDARISFRRARFHGGVWLSYLAGGILGAFIALHWDLWSLTLPLAALANLIVFDFARGTARA
jgi:uncharacterized membrane protein YoaK (UPF0700 family)